MENRNSTSSASRRQLSERQARERRRRINHYKRMIVWTCAILIIVPIIMCIFLMIRIHMLEKDIDDLLSMKEAGTIVAKIDDAGNRYLVMASEIDTDEKDSQVQQDETSTEAMATEQTQEATTEIPKAEPATTDEYTGKRAYLTFDDGPSSNTIPILDTLDACGVTGTFFVIAKTDDVSMSLYKEIVNRGSTLALHSYTHQYSSIYASLDTFANDVTQIHNLVQQVTGEDIHMYRFPGGSANTTTNVDVKDMVRWLRSNGYRYVDWNVSSEDATGKELTAQQIAQIVVSEALTCNNAYILMHDSNGKNSTVESIPMIVQQLQANGFKFYSINDNTEPLIQQVKESTIQ